MKANKHIRVTCPTCKGDRFDKDNQLCLRCGGDGCVLRLEEANIPHTIRGERRLARDMVFGLKGE